MSSPAAADALAGLTEIAPGSIGTVELGSHAATPDKLANWFARFLGNPAFPADSNGRSYGVGALYDVGGFDIGAGGITIPQHGYYLLTVRGFDYSILGNVMVGCLLNSTTCFMSETQTLVSGDQPEGAGQSAQFEFNAADQINWFGWAAAGGTCVAELTILCLGVLP